ncbi:hypothetical protein Q7C36_002801 [Tachysurus vachellii]|uniref:Uncharacterized protein n=1 Tax=Tachysurus vachellii TaxID=175792 RepID=A0AA88NYI7_TACVA|nr:hypothetical protein Q7C36_002801 [Tachysurus vachellii]
MVSDLKGKTEIKKVIMMSKFSQREAKKPQDCACVVRSSPDAPVPLGNTCEEHLRNTGGRFCSASED